jgi:hypothetical protein
MSTFDDAFRRWHELRIPSGTRGIPAIDDIFGDIVVVDLWLAGDATRIAKGGQAQPTFTDVEAAIDRVEAKIHTLLGAKDKPLTDHDRALTNEYFSYLEILRALNSAIDETRRLGT